MILNGGDVGKYADEDYDKAKLAAADPSACPYRHDEYGDDDGYCSVLTAETGNAVTIYGVSCKVCIAAGTPDRDINPVLRARIAHLCFNRIVPGPFDSKARSVDEATLANCYAKVREMAGVQVTDDLLETLVYSQTITAEKAAEMSLLSAG